LTQNYEHYPNEIYFHTYPVLNAIARQHGDVLLDDVTTLYSIVIKDERLKTKLLSKILNDDDTEKLVSRPSVLRELHWTVLLKELILKNSKFAGVDTYIRKLSKNQVLIKNELLAIANKALYENGQLQSMLINNLISKGSRNEKECLGIILPMQPQPNLNLDTKVKQLFAHFSKVLNIPISKEFDAQITKIQTNLELDVTKKYTKKWDEYSKSISHKEVETIKILDNIKNKLKQKKLKAEKEAADKIEGLKMKIAEAEQELAKIKEKNRKDQAEHTRISKLKSNPEQLNWLYPAIIIGLYAVIGLVIYMDS